MVRNKNVSTHDNSSTSCQRRNVKRTTEQVHEPICRPGDETFGGPLDTRSTSRKTSISSFVPPPLPPSVLWKTLLMDSLRRSATGIVVRSPFLAALVGFAIQS